MSEGDSLLGWDSDGPPGSTPLDPDETEGLKPAWVATRADLNEVEQANILQALGRAKWHRITSDALLDDKSARDLHRDMFGDVWIWAGKYRRSEKNIGVAPSAIGVGVRDLMLDAKAWLAGDQPMPADQAAYELHHKLVSIHPFPNGNGRHARALTDILLRSLGAAPFTWGRASLDTISDVRRRYIAALRAADRGDYGPLASFVRS
jgi:Fic-DOC domain mobile mystery protein B